MKTRYLMLVLILSSLVVKRALTYEVDTKNYYSLKLKQ
jgi:hypothetical protein